MFLGGMMWKTGLEDVAFFYQSRSALEGKAECIQFMSEKKESVRLHTWFDFLRWEVSGLAEIRTLGISINPPCKKESTGGLPPLLTSAHYQCCPSIQVLG